METINISVGSFVIVNGLLQNKLREVKFTGECLGERTEYGFSDRSGTLTDMRGVTQTLYRTADGRFVVHVAEWSRWQGEPTVYSLLEVTQADLSLGGEYEALGREAGLGRPLTLDEALSL